MPIQIDSTQKTCAFCAKQGLQTQLVRSMHGLYCTNEDCYSRVSGGNLVPPVECDDCKENSFYLETENTPETGVYLCIACGHQTPID